MSTKTILVLSSFIFLFLAACNSQENPDELIVEYGKTTGIPEIDAISQDIQNNPKDASLYAIRAEAYSLNGLYKEAVNDAEMVLSMDSTKWQSYKLLAWMYLDNDESKRSIKTLEKGLEIFPDNIKLLLTHAEISHILKQYDKGLISAENILKKEPYNTDAMFTKGLILKDMKDTLGAIRIWDAVVSQDADHFGAYLELGNIFYKMRKPVATAYYKNALRIDSTSYLALKGMANYYHQTGSLEKAKEAYERTIYHHPQEAETSYDYALLYMELEEYEKAYNFFNVAVQYDPQFGEAYYYKAFAAEKLGNIEDAITNYKNAESNGSKNNRLRATDALERLEKK